AEDIRALSRVKSAVAAGKPLPMALREARVWGDKERLFERILPQLDTRVMAQWLDGAQVCDGLIKGLKQPEWPVDPWQGLKRLVLMLLQQTRTATAKAPREASTLALQA
ncbi:MAG: DNA polymerase III subunit delta, partial [Rhizobacter sp.]|nr:DNA polymerase III subunit delta [Rhizobacter sp.]